MFDKKSVYHSVLAKAGDIRVKIKSGSIKSKFADKEGKAGEYFVIFEYDGVEHIYLAETPAVAKFLGRFKDQDITIRATGANENARIEVLNSDGTVKPPEEQKAPHAPHGSENGDPEAGANKAKIGVMLALKKAVEIEEAFKLAYPGRVLSDSQFQAITSTIFINLDKQGLIQ